MKNLVAFVVFSNLLNSILSSPISNRTVLSKHHDRIYGGEYTKPNEYPFTVTAFILPGPTICGGAVISKDYILTTAQYLYDSDNVFLMYIYLGAHQFNDLYEDGRENIFIDGEDLPSYMIIHENFNPDTLVNNIALIKLRSSLAFSDTIQSIKLPPPTLTALSLVGKTATLMGWGESEVNEDIEYPNHVNVTIMHQAVCHHFYAAEDQSMALCTDGEFRKGACEGDVGTPLITTLKDDDDDSIVILGIVSFIHSVGCDAQWPTIYTSTIAHLDWIQEHMVES